MYRLRELDEDKYAYEKLVNCRSFNMLFKLANVNPATLLANLSAKFENETDIQLKRRYPSVTLDYPIPELRFILKEAHRRRSGSGNPHEALAAHITNNKNWVPDSLSKLLFEEMRQTFNPGDIYKTKEHFRAYSLPVEQNLAYYLAESFSEIGKGKIIAYIGGPEFMEKHPEVLNLLFNRTKRVKLDRGEGLGFIILEYNKADVNVRPIDVNYDICGWNHGLYDSFMRILKIFETPCIDIQCQVPLDDLLARERIIYEKHDGLYVAGSEVIARKTDAVKFGKRVCGFKINSDTKIGNDLLLKYKDTLYGGDSCVYVLNLRKKLSLPKRFFIWGAGLYKSFISRDILMTAYSNVEFQSETLAKRVQDTTLELREWQAKALKFLNQLVPEVISDQLLNSKYATRELDIGISFADISGFSCHTERLERKTLLENLICYFSMVAEQTVKFGGWPANFMGDCLMSVCGTPFGTKTYMMDPLLIALESNRIMENPKLKEGYGIPSDWHQRVGINAGPAITGPSGSAGVVDRVQYDVFGLPVNIAARLQRIAEPGDIVVGEAIYGVAKRHFDFQYLGEKELRNIEILVKAYKLLGLKKIAESERVSKTCPLAESIDSLENEVNKYKQIEFPDVPFLQAESIDGSLQHSTAVAIYSLALARKINQNPAVFGLNSPLDEELIMSAALIHEIGRIKTNRLAYMANQIKSEDKVYLEEKGFLRLPKMPDDTIDYILENLRLPKNREDKIINILRSLYLNRGIESQIISLADAYDRFMVPPSYKTHPLLDNPGQNPYNLALGTILSYTHALYPGLSEEFCKLLQPRK